MVDDLPMTAFLENAMPHSLPILEAIYAKLNSNGSSINTPEHYSPEHVVWQIVKYFASQDEESVSQNRPQWARKFKKKTRAAKKTREIK